VKVSTFRERQWPCFWSTHHDGAIYLYVFGTSYKRQTSMVW